MTHPFHPLYGQEFELVDRRSAWGEDRVYFLDDQGELKRMPTTELANWLTSQTAGNMHVSAPFKRADIKLNGLSKSSLEIMLAPGNLLLESQWKARNTFAGTSNYHVDTVPGDFQVNLVLPRILSQPRGQ